MKKFNRTYKKGVLMMAEVLPLGPTNNNPAFSDAVICYSSKRFPSHNWEEGSTVVFFWSHKFQELSHLTCSVDGSVSVHRSAPLCVLIKKLGSAQEKELIVEILKNLLEVMPLTVNIGLGRREQISTILSSYGLSLLSVNEKTVSIQHTIDRLLEDRGGICCFCLTETCNQLCDECELHLNGYESTNSDFVLGEHN